jgi:L-rhamnose isomerase / sugar isomerase
MDPIQTKRTLLEQKYGEQKINEVLNRIQSLRVDVPSWGFGRGGTRFGTYRTGNEATNAKERIHAAREAYTRAKMNGSVAFHFPWDGDSLSDCEAIKAALEVEGLTAGAVNTNMFDPRPQLGLDARVRFGSFTNPDRTIQELMVEHNLQALEYMRILRTNALSLWFPDGTNSPGQLSFYDQADWMEQNLKKIYDALNPNETMYIEYKLFEPGFYSTAIADWGRALSICKRLGKQAQILVDLGHHALGTNIEQIVALLIREGKLGGFHFNDKKYADDDLATASLDPFQLFRVFVVMLEGEKRGLVKVDSVNFLLDQSHNIKHPTDEVVESLENIRLLYAKALLVDYDALQDARLNCDPTRGDSILKKAFWEDVTSLLPN